MPIIDNWKLVVLQRYAKFDGRAGRAEYWWFFLANVIVHVTLAALALASSVFFILLILWWLAVLVPTAAVGVRRLHDTNKSGWLLLIFLAPIVGPVLLIVFLAIEGDGAPNQYGPLPTGTA